MSFAPGSTSSQKGLGKSYFPDLIALNMACPRWDVAVEAHYVSELLKTLVSAVWACLTLLQPQDW